MVDSLSISNLLKEDRMFLLSQRCHFGLDNRLNKIYDTLDHQSGHQNSSQRHFRTVPGIWFGDFYTRLS